MVDFDCIQNMTKDASLFSSLNKEMEEEIFVIDDYALTIASCDKIECQNSVIIVCIKYQI